MTAPVRTPANRTAKAAQRGQRSPAPKPSGTRVGKAEARPVDPPERAERGLWSTVEGLSPVVARVLLGLVLAWFGYHELVAPGQWTGYVPVLAGTSAFAQVLVLAHGWLLLVIAVALVAGVAPRVAAAAASVLLVEIVISLIASGGLSDLVLRDVGVLGLAVALVGARHDRLLLRR
jgi:uncharacterized membrane protein YphA (DoxX/SURF4 family)